jgi:hypothetical protein
MGEPSPPDVPQRLADAVNEMRSALEIDGPLTGADALVHLPPSILQELSVFREEVGAAVALYAENSWDQHDPEAPHFELFREWHRVVVFLYQQGHHVDEELPEGLEG